MRAVHDVFDCSAAAGRCAWSGSCAATRSASPRCASAAASARRCSRRGSPSSATPAIVERDRRRGSLRAHRFRPRARPSPLRDQPLGRSKRTHRIILGVVSTPELSVVCKSCGSEVSPYVTECPYCGTRMRKRAPKLERKGDELSAREPKRRKLRPRLPKLSKPRVSVAADRPYATIALILAPAILILVIRATGKPLIDFGAIVGPVETEWWRYAASPFVYDDIGYLFVGRRRGGALRLGARAAAGHDRDAAAGGRLRRPRHARRRRHRDRSRQQHPHHRRPRRQRNRARASLRLCAGPSRRSAGLPLRGGRGDRHRRRRHGALRPAAGRRRRQRLRRLRRRCGRRPRRPRRELWRQSSRRRRE